MTHQGGRFLQHRGICCLLNAALLISLVAGKSSGAFARQRRQSASSRSLRSDSLLSLPSPALLLSLRGGDMDRKLAVTADYGSHIESAYGWCVNLGAPSALIAGAVVATLYENMHSGDLEVTNKDSWQVQFGKKLTRLLLLSAFALETLSIFVTTVTGTMLLSASPREIISSDVSVNTPLEFLRENFEFEYLTARITFLQGLLNWLAAIALGHILPSANDPTPTRSVQSLNNFIACSLTSLIVLMISFYNNHMTFYRNYWHMLYRWGSVTFQRFFGVAVRKGTWPPRPLSLVLLPSLLLSLYWGYCALAKSETEEKVDKPLEKFYFGGRRANAAQ